METNRFLINMGKRIYERRKELKMTQETVAEKMGLSLQSVSCIELGKKAIRPENLVKLCEVLKISPDYILTGTRSKEELKGIYKDISALSKEDYIIVNDLIKRLNRN